MRRIRARDLTWVPELTVDLPSLLQLKISVSMYFRNLNWKERVFLLTVFFGCAGLGPRAS